MPAFSRRGLTAAERAALSPGLLAAIEAAGVEPEICARPSAPACFVMLWRRRLPVMVLGRRIFWPGAAEDFSGDPLRLSVLQHELQHVLDFATGALTATGYALRPRNWTYRYRLSGEDSWSALGAEQRAMLAQDYWLAGRGLLRNAPSPEQFRRLIPWAGGEG